jgi:hypothetical protein
MLDFTIPSLVSPILTSGLPALILYDVLPLQSLLSDYTVAL